MKPTLHVLSPGLSTTVQDLGRPGHQWLGIPVGGALDPVRLRAANALIGNPPDAGALEVLYIGPRLAVEADSIRMSFAGADPIIEVLAGADAAHGTLVETMRSIRLQRGAVILPVTGLSVFATRRPRDHLARGLSQSISQTFTVIAFSLMPLAGAIAINFSAPLWSALLSVLWLKERAGGARWTALLSGFVGVLVVANPGQDSLTLGALFALANAIMYGSVTVAVRGMTATESTNTLLMWQLAILAVVHTCLLVFGFRVPTAADAALLVASGIANALAQYLWTRALHLAPAAAVSPFYYLLLVWALLIGFVFWGDVPSVGLLAGSAIVVLSGLFLLWHETRRSRSRLAQSMPLAAQAANVLSASHAVMMSPSLSAGTGALNR
jgi:drug/metabolite transporter (DMT)-like permease